VLRKLIFSLLANIIRGFCKKGWPGKNTLAYLSGASTMMNLFKR
jgi:hypothetical protein